MTIPEEVRRLEAVERQRLLSRPTSNVVVERPTIHWSELPAAEPGSRAATEWNFYRNQVGQLLADGHQGRWVLIKGAEIVGIWDTQKQANEVRAKRFLMQDV
jgi:hypothetical protein